MTQDIITQLKKNAIPLSAGFLIWVLIAWTAYHTYYPKLIKNAFTESVRKQGNSVENNWLQDYPEIEQIITRITNAIFDDQRLKFLQRRFAFKRINTESVKLLQEKVIDAEFPINKTIFISLLDIKGQAVAQRQSDGETSFPIDSTNITELSEEKTIEVIPWNSRIFLSVKQPIYEKDEKTQQYTNHLGYLHLICLSPVQPSKSGIILLSIFIGALLPLLLVSALLSRKYAGKINNFFREAFQKGIAYEKKDILKKFGIKPPNPETKQHPENEKNNKREKLRYPPPESAAPPIPKAPQKRPDNRMPPMKGRTMNKAPGHQRKNENNWEEPISKTIEIPPPFPPLNKDPGTKRMLRRNKAAEDPDATIIVPNSGVPTRSDAMPRPEKADDTSDTTSRTEQDETKHSFIRLKKGNLIDEYYEILETIGKGGAGIVYKVKDNEMDRLFAVKVLNNAKLKEGFINEANVSIELHHENIVKVHPMRKDKHNGFYYLVMDYINGCNLKKWLREHPEITYGQVIQILKQVCDGLQYAHDKNTCHRDIKPENIMISTEADAENPHISLVDFGLSKFKKGKGKGDVTRFGGGTPKYMAPEQHRGVSDSKADIYSVSVVAFLILTGGDLPEEPGKTNISTLNSELSPEVGEVLNKAMSYYPSDRHESISLFFAKFAEEMDRSGIPLTESVTQKQEMHEEDDPTI